MAWYLRKSVSIGPVRLNVSRSGIGTSVGIKGFRIGVKPNGRSYIHAGRHGLYYREGLGSIKQNIQEANQCTLNVLDTTIFKTISSTELASESKRDFINQLNESYKAFRLDYLVGLVSLIAAIFTFNANTNLMLCVILLGIISTTLVARWESHRRTINIFYEFENDNYSRYEQIILAFNYIAECKCIWSLLTSRKLYNTHESKLNAGASTLIDRLAISAGRGNPPWVQTNITIPILKTTGRSLYFMPDGILIYDDKGVGLIEYTGLKITFDTTRFIEDFTPSDAKIVGTTWKYANVNGGPDRRFNNNSKLSICLYGELKIEAQGHLLLYIMTSQSDAPKKFKDSLSNIVKNSAKSEKISRNTSQEICSNNQVSKKSNTIIETNQHELDYDIQNVPNQTFQETHIQQELFSNPNVVVDDSSISWNKEMHKLLDKADILLNDKKYKEAETKYNELLDFARLQNNSLYNSLAINRLKDIKDKIDSCKSNTVIDPSISWNDKMHELLDTADILLKNKKYKEAKIKYDELLNLAKVQKNSLYNSLVFSRLEELKDKTDSYDPCYPSALFDIKMINEIIEDARFHEVEKDYKKALSKYIEVRMYGIMYSSSPYIDLAKTKIEELKRLEG